MANNSTGVYKLANGNWAYRIYMTLDGKKIDTTGRKDVNGKPLETKTEAKKAREQKLVELRNGTDKKAIKDIRMSELWQAYLNQFSKDKATATVTKYSSIWKNHVKVRFGDKYISKLTTADLYAFLLELYKDRGYAYGYVESFLKLFYQLYGIAYSMERISPEKYTRMFIDKGTKLRMPNISQEDQKKLEEVRSYTPEEIKQIQDIFKDGNLYTAFLLGYYLGVRISECFGLMWSDVDFEKHMITIDKQMNYEENMFCLGPVKTYASVRTIYIPDILYAHLKEKYDEYNRVKDNLAYRNYEIVMNKVSDKPEEHFPIKGGDFINRKSNGELLTINSVKAWALKIKDVAKIDFEYHSLRKTHISILVSMNVPPKETMRRIGHKKYETTLKHYTRNNKLSSAKMKAALNAMCIDETIVEVEVNNTVLQVPQHILNQFIAEYQKVA